MGWKRLWALTIALLAGLTCASPALADDPVYMLPRAVVTAKVAPDGSVAVTQDLTFSFNRAGHGAYVDVPRPVLSRLTDIAVSEDGRPYRKGADAEIGVERPPGTFGEKTCSADGAHRIVWYFDAEPGSIRTFRVRYTMHRAVAAYDDHAFLQLPVWGRNWSQPLERLDVTVRLPRAGREGEVYLAKGAPVEVLEPVVGASRQVTKATAEDVVGGRPVTLYLAFPTAQLNNVTTSPSVRLVSGDGAERLESLRQGDVETDPYQGEDCPTGEDGFSLSDALWLTAGAALVAMVVWTSRVQRKHGPRRHGSGDGSGSSTYYHSGGSSSSSDSGSSGGGGGAW
ncbi:hypothetical protein GCM10010106_18090 [Thermopolyspora flexuosa]|jgi:hypothetical protein|uniref:Putative membrane protein DUF2207 n=1 Tax=Thermopolyspora flexuosa TaxID=103836 RepID=A0A543J447_9ACTN|nr:DUF2207 domain-containing protein [Thermopolyspora flexuosa]TQM77605.1 putative membrane protein DUF2207 [Thermopolyspora flexuosa]GGM72175.1 hypothetical protein GCM10010106_18090 [Thermopolyspora flexuosa]